MSRTNLLALAAVCAALVAIPMDVQARGGRGGRGGCGGGGHHGGCGGGGCGGGYYGGCGMTMGCGGCGNYGGCGMAIGCGGCGSYGGCGMTMGCGGCGMTMGCGGGMLMPYAGGHGASGIYIGSHPVTGGKKKGDTGGKKKKAGPDNPDEISLPIEASIVVNLPANARLSVDGQATTSTGSVRLFRTPALEQGHSYTYTLRAELERDGRTETVSRQVVVRPGEQTQIDFAIPAEGVASR